MYNNGDRSWFSYFQIVIWFFLKSECFMWLLPCLKNILSLVFQASASVCNCSITIASSFLNEGGSKTLGAALWHCEVDWMPVYKQDRHAETTTAIKNFCVEVCQKTEQNELNRPREAGLLQLNSNFAQSWEGKASSRWRALKKLSLIIWVQNKRGSSSQTW